ncbi:hypothetical protein CYCD_18090 [Tenuifilaceae bacterium CYCD]|nr:hypothetical protein CYCD_18090 [Tenuifilaceae bacterium CYCD]
MNNHKLVYSILFLFFVISCTQHKEKTEIKLQLSEAEYFHSLSGHSNDSTFNAVFEQTLKNYDPAKEEFVTTFEKTIDELQPEFLLASIFNTFEFSDRIHFNSTNQEILSILKDDIKQTKQKTAEILKKRIEFALPTSLLNKLEVIINESAESNSYTITVNRKVDESQIKPLLEKRGNLEFWETYEISSIWDFLNNANNETKTIANNSTNKSLFEILNPATSSDGQLQRGALIGTTHINDTAMVNQYLRMPSIIGMLPRDLKFIWSTKVRYSDEDYVQLYALKISSRSGEAPLTSQCIVNAKAETSNYPSVLMEMNAEGARVWQRLTAENIGLQIAIVLDNVLYTAPFVQASIESGKSQITGDFTSEEASNLAAILNAGYMPEISVKVIAIN